MIGSIGVKAKRPMPCATARISIPDTAISIPAGPCVASDVASPAMCASVQIRPSMDDSLHAGGASARGLFAACQDPASQNTRRSEMGVGMILLIVLVLALLGVIPTWPHSRQWGYYPSGGIGLVLLIIVILLLLGRI
jgi:Protein of unknown function (DUF3309)